VDPKRLRDPPDLYSIAYGKEKFLASGEKGIVLLSEPVTFASDLGFFNLPRF